MKVQRRAKILELIQTHDVETQEELTELLREAGFAVTQATVSRDIKDLRLLKVQTDDDRYKYAPGPHEDDARSAVRFRNILKETVVKVDWAQNLIILKTYSGMANAAAAAIDAMNWSEIVGSLAGDDTIFLAVRMNEDAQRCARELVKMIE